MFQRKMKRFNRTKSVVKPSEWSVYWLLVWFPLIASLWSYPYECNDQLLHGKSCSSGSQREGAVIEGILHTCWNSRIPAKLLQLNSRINMCLKYLVTFQTSVILSSISKFFSSKRWKVETLLILPAFVICTNNIRDKLQGISGK